MARNKFDVDETLNAQFNKDQVKRLGKYTRKQLKPIIITMLLMFVSSFLGLLPPYYTQIVINQYIPDQNYRALFIIAGLLIVAQIISCIIMKHRALIINRVGQDIIHDLRFDLFQHLQKLPFTYFDSRPHGKILVRVVNYVNALADLLSNGIINILTSIFSLFVIIGFMLVMDVQFTLVCLAGMPVFMIIIFFIKTHHRQAWQKFSSKQSNLNAYIHESISGIKVTQSFAREEENFHIFKGLCDENKQTWMRAKLIEMSIPNVVQIISVSTVTLVYVLGVSRISNHLLEVGTVIAFTSYISRFWQPIVQLATYYNQIITASAYVERIFETIDEPLIVDNLPNAEELPPIQGRVEFEDVTFAYEDGDRNILDHVSFTIEPGMTIALVGPTGAGKTTVINLISRFYDIQSGKILIDGHDIKHVTLDSLRRQMGIMLQDSFLFSGTIMDNIRYGKLDATDQQVIEAAKAVCAHDFIINFPDGYQTYVNERGSSLSAGQRQLISFARALLANPAILILDEATSSIDTETEIALQKGLDRLLENRTSFIIAHRLSTIKNSDQILYIADGGIQEAGTHDELIAKKGKYYELYMAQYRFLDAFSAKG